MKKIVSIGSPTIALLLIAVLAGCEDVGGDDMPQGGTSGTGGSSAGTSGTAGVAGTSGSGAGTSNVGGTSGSGGSQTGGSAGQGGAGTGGAGTSGSAGATAGSSSSGAAGLGGASGAAGATGGSAGSAGSAGGGAAGANGGAGASGAAGASGSAGTGGTTGSGSDGCGTETARPNPNQQQTMQIQGTTRYYLIYVPENYDPEEPLSLVFAFHGLDMNNWWAAHDQSGFRLIEATDDQAILVYPQGSGDEPGTTSRWGNINSSWNAGGQDLEFVDALIDDVLGKYCVDTDRVFSTGFSMGGMMTNELGCRRGDVFRGIAPVAGWGPGSSPGGGSASCQDANAKPAVLVTHGTTDDVIGIASGRGSRDFWRGRAGCEEASMPGLNNCILYQGCDAGLAAGYCEHGGAHMVPGTTGENVWEFFSSLP